MSLQPSYGRGGFFYKYKPLVGNGNDNGNTHGGEDNNNGNNNGNKNQGFLKHGANGNQNGNCKGGKLNQGYMANSSGENCLAHTIAIQTTKTECHWLAMYHTQTCVPDPLYSTKSQAYESTTNVNK